MDTKDIDRIKPFRLVKYFTFTSLIVILIGTLVLSMVIARRAETVLIRKSEDYALLMGSIGLFIVLAVIMYLTRKIDWYTSPQEIKKSSPAQPLDAPAR